MVNIFGDILDNFWTTSQVLTTSFEVIGGSAGEEVPLKLIERNNSTLWFALSGLTISFLLIALSNFGTNKLALLFGRVLYKNASIEKIIQEEYSLVSMSSILLLLNFIITSTILLYLSYLYNFNQNNYELFYLFPALPLYFFLWPLIWFNIIGFITGEGKLMTENKKNAILFAQIIGLLFALLLLIWTFNFKWSFYFIYAFVGILGVFWIFKLLRGIIFSRQHQISWAYILLYAITLEFLPLIVCYSFLYK